MPVKLGAFATLDEDFPTFLAQYGVEDVILGPAHLPTGPATSGDGTLAALSYLGLVQFRKRCEAVGLRLSAIVGAGQKTPAFTMDKIWLGQPGRDEQIENIAANIRVMGNAGIPYLTYHWNVNPPGMYPASWRTTYKRPGRGGAMVSRFDGEIADALPMSRERQFSEDEMWAGYEYFIKAIIPVCEEVGVKLALHPNDPPVERLGGIPWLFHDDEGFQRAMDIADSPNSGITFCIGNWTAMGIDILESIRRFGPQGKIFFGHAQGVQGAVPTFDECFLDEADCDFLAIIRKLNDVGCDCFLAPSHLPHTECDTAQQHDANAYALGYLRGLIQGRGTVAWLTAKALGKSGLVGSVRGLLAPASIICRDPRWEDNARMPVRIGSFASESDTDGYLRFLKQYGVEDIVLGLGDRLLSKFPPDGAERPGFHLDFLDLVQVRTRFEEAGLRVIALENPAPKQYFVSAMLGLPDRDAVIEDLIATIRNFGRAGIPTIGYHWMVNPPGQPSGSSRTSHTTPGRGGAQVGSFHWEDAKYAPLARDREYTEEEMWANYEYFIKAVMPACEEAGVRLALHPPDPPVHSLGGAPRLFHTFEGYQRAMEIADSPMSGLNMCLGNWTAMGTDILAAVEYFGSRGRIFYGHAQGVNGVAPTFDECFLDEADCDFLAVIRALNEVGFDSCLAPGHFPHTVGDANKAQNGSAYTFGYLRALIQSASR